MLAQAKAFVQEEKLFEANQFLKLAIFHNPKLAEAHNMLGRMYRGNKNPRTKILAERALTEAMQLVPTDIEYVLDLAEYYAENEQYSRARQYLDRAQTLKQKHPRAQDSQGHQGEGMNLSGRFHRLFGGEQPPKILEALVSVLSRTLDIPLAVR